MKKPNPHTLIQAILYAAIFAFYIFLKRKWSFTAPTLWAEDGMFLGDAKILGIKSLFTFYAGYLHFYPRILSLLMTTLFPERSWAMLIIGILFLAQVCMAVDIAQSKRSLGNWSAFFCGLCILALPHSGETYVNLANFQWPLTIWIFDVLFLRDKTLSRTRAWIVIGAVFSSPFCAILLTASLIFRYQKKIILFFMGSIAVFFQVLHPLLFDRAVTQVSHSEFLSDLPAMGFRVAEGIAGGIWPRIWIILLIVFLISILRRSPQKIVLLGIFLLYLCVITLRLKGAIALANAHDRGARYFFPLYGMIFLTLIAETTGKTRFAAICFCFGMPLQRNFESNINFPLVQSWSESVSKRNRVECKIPILPPGWSVNRCRQL